MTHHVSNWVRNMKCGWLRSYLIAVFLPPTRQERRENLYFGF